MDGRPKTTFDEFDMRGHGDIVAYVIAEKFGGSPTSLALALTQKTGLYVSRQKIDGWRKRGQFPVEWIEPVYELTRVPLRALLARCDHH